MPIFLDRWASFYGSVRRGEAALVALAAAHQRLGWVHPFVDGNGRVMRLHTHTLLSALGCTGGQWSPLRGFARNTERYYALLANADSPRWGALDGRGNLSEQALVAWIDHVQGALVKRRLLKSDSPQGQERFGLPQHALRFLFPRLRPEAEADSASLLHRLGVECQIAPAVIGHRPFANHTCQAVCSKAAGPRAITVLGVASMKQPFVTSHTRPETLTLSANDSLP